VAAAEEVAVEQEAGAADELPRRRAMSPRLGRPTTTPIQDRLTTTFRFEL
jgi:hypothetical protein